MTYFEHVIINGVDRKADVLRTELIRTMNSIGSWEVLLRNTAGKYNGTFDVQQDFGITVNEPDPGGTLMVGVVDGPAVTLRGRDLESTWDEYVVVRGVDQAQDLLFHNDFDRDYPDTTQGIVDVLSDVLLVQLAGLTNIGYSPGVNTLVGAMEFREGASFLSQVQELMRRSGHVFYVSDGRTLYHGQPGWSAAPAPSVFRSIAGDSTNNIIDIVDYQTRDGDKHYNYVRLIGKSPMFDGYTEYNAGSWTSTVADPPINDVNTVMVGTYSQVAYNHNPCNVNLEHQLNCPLFNYTSWDFTDGEVGIWGRYDNTAAAPGVPAPGAGSAAADEYVECRLEDAFGDVVVYYGASSRLYRDHWGYCTFPLGEGTNVSGVYSADHWVQLLAPVGEFQWGNVVRLGFTCPGGAFSRSPSHFYIDGISLPIPVVSIMEDVAAQVAYRRRPFVDIWAHVRTQHSMDNYARLIRDQSKSTEIKKLSFVTPGTKSLRYAGQTIDINIPALGINTEVFYITQLHHIIEPMADVSGGYGFDWITKVDSLPTSGEAYDVARLRTGPLYSAAQSATHLGGGASRR